MKILIGRSDIASFPELELKNIKVKVDTGAYTSAIRASEIKEIKSAEGKYIQFSLPDCCRDRKKTLTYKFEKYSRKRIKNSFGQTEERFIIKTRIALFGMLYPISLSLSERSELKNPVLLGRKFLNNRFIVDPKLKNLSYNQKK